MRQKPWTFLGDSLSPAGKRRRVGLVPTINNDERHRQNSEKNDTFRVGDWRWFRWNSTGCVGSGKFYAGEIVNICEKTVIWEWFSDRTRDSRTTFQLRKETTPFLTSEEQLKLDQDSSLSRDEVHTSLEHRNSPSQHQRTQNQTNIDVHTQQISLDGFRNIANRKHWNEVLYQWLPTFDPTAFLTRKIQAAAPKGTARSIWVDCIRAVTNLVSQFEVKVDGIFQSSDIFDQLQMWIRCMPAIILRVKPRDSHITAIHLINRRCSQFLRGEWKLLYQSAVSEISLRNQIARNKYVSAETGSQTTEKRHQMALEQARNLNYARAMTTLRSPGLSTDPPSEIYEKLKQLHPPQTPHLTVPDPAFAIDQECFDKIDGEWIRGQFKKTKSGTALDQWGWDSKEMWQDILKDEQLATDIARHWILPVAMGYLPSKYKEHLIGGRLVALSKFPKPGVRPVCVTDVWRRIAAKGLLFACHKELKHFFQNCHPRTFQFAGASKNGASDMYHLLNTIFQDIKTSRDCNDPLVILTLDIKNAFNTLSRQAIFDFMASGCTKASGNETRMFQGWDML